MDWAALGLTDRVLAWLEAASRERYANEARFDPYATSMRDFDDVGGDLRAIGAGKMPARNRANQRVVDLRGASGFVDPTALALNPLGSAVLRAWERYKIVDTGWGDEAARLLLTIFEARKLKDARYAHFEAYWADLRVYFDPLQLIDQWDRLYALNYMDYEQSGFRPGAILRQEGIGVPQIEFDLGSFARTNRGSRSAIEGGSKLADAIRGKVPRGRHRASFAIALELSATGATATTGLLDRFGVPQRPRQWTAFQLVQKDRIRQILADYAPLQGAGQPGRPAAPPPAAAAALPAPPTPAPTLPPNIDFSTVLKPVPRPRCAADTRKAGRAITPRKVDHQKKAKADDEVGRLGEEFAMGYEKWRLRGHPDLLKKIRHVSLIDDTLGYDIESFETDGSPRYVEVKGTLGPLETRFFLSSNELAAAEKKRAAYVILRTALLDQRPECCEIRHPFGELEMKTAVYSVTFKAAAVAQPMSPKAPIRGDSA